VTRRAAKTIVNREFLTCENPLIAEKEYLAAHPPNGQVRMAAVIDEFGPASAH
jgi:hypothetical protein